MYNKYRSLDPENTASRISVEEISNHLDKKTFIINNGNLLEKYQGYYRDFDPETQGDFFATPLVPFNWKSEDLIYFWAVSDSKSVNETFQKTRTLILKDSAQGSTYSKAIENAISKFKIKVHPKPILFEVNDFVEDDRKNILSSIKEIFKWFNIVYLILAFMISMVARTEETKEETENLK